MTPPWKLLRTKTDEATADADWVGGNDAPDESIIDQMYGGTANSGYFHGIEVVVIGVNASGTPVDRAAMTVDLALVAALRRPPSANAGDDPDEVWYDTSTQDAVPLQTPCYFPFNGGRFTIRISDNASIAGVAALQVWYRPVFWGTP